MVGRQPSGDGYAQGSKGCGIGKSTGNHLAGGEVSITSGKGDGQRLLRQPHQCSVEHNCGDCFTISQIL